MIDKNFVKWVEANYNRRHGKNTFFISQDNNGYSTSSSLLCNNCGETAEYPIPKFTPILTMAGVCPICNKRHIINFINIYNN